MPPSSEQYVAGLRAELLVLMDAIAQEEAAQREQIDAALPQHRVSARNLAHYLALRNQDIHLLQLELAAIGLSSLGRCEGHVRDILRRLCAWLSGEMKEATSETPPDELDRTTGRVDSSRQHQCAHRSSSERSPHLHHGHRT